MVEWGHEMNNKLDILTGLYNRVWLKMYIADLLKNKQRVAVALMNIDFFSNINDKIGRENGDRVLKRISSFLTKDKKILVARYGGDEFVILYVNKDDDHIKENIKCIKKMLYKNKFIDVYPYEKVPIKFSIGVAFSSDNLRGTFLLLKSAEIALLNAKKKGRNRIEFSQGQKMNFIKNEGICTTVIGRSLKGQSINNEVAYFASISQPYGVDLDINGDLLYVDRSNHQVKRIQNNRIYNVAGCGKCGFSGDGHAPIDAKLCKPSGIAVHESGRIYIADTGNHCIRVIDKKVIKRIAGNGESGYSGDGSDAVDAKLNRPGGVVVDEAGNIYTNDYGNNVIRKIDTNGIITTVAGNGEYGYEGDNGNALQAKIDRPYGLCIKPDGKILYIADYGNHCVRMVDLETNKIETLCGNGQPGYSGDGDICHNATLNGPYWLLLHENKLLIADAHNHCIRQIDLSTKIITTLVGNGEPGYVDTKSDIDSVRLNIPAGIIMDKKNLYIADYGNNAIRKLKV